MKSKNTTLADFIKINRAYITPAIYQKCNKKILKTTKCEHPAGYGTEHSGKDFCYLHGGIRSKKFTETIEDIKYKNILDSLKQDEVVVANPEFFDVVLDRLSLEKNLIRELHKEVINEDVLKEQMVLMRLGKENSETANNWLKIEAEINKNKDRNDLIRKEKLQSKFLDCFEEGVWTAKKTVIEIEKLGIKAPLFLYSEYLKEMSIPREESIAMDGKAQDENYEKHKRILESEELVEKNRERLRVLQEGFINGIIRKK